MLKWTDLNTREQYGSPHKKELFSTESLILLFLLWFHQAKPIFSNNHSTCTRNGVPLHTKAHVNRKYQSTCRRPTAWEYYCENTTRQIILDHDYNIFFNLASANIMILHSKDEYNGQSKSYFASYPLCYITFVNLNGESRRHAMPVIKGRSGCDPLLHNNYIRVFECGKINSYTTDRKYHRK